MKRLFLFLIIQSFFLLARSQYVLVSDTIRLEVPMNRVLWHENLDKEQKRSDKLDGRVDGMFKLTDNDDLNLQIADALLRSVDRIQFNIENSGKDANTKVGYLRGLKELLQEFNNQIKAKKSVAAFAPQLIESYQECVSLQAANQPMQSVFEKAPWLVGEILAPLFPLSPEASLIRQIVYLKKSQENPSAILPGLAEFAQTSFADSLAVVAARKVPLELYSFAQAVHTPQGKLLRRSNDPTVKMIVRLSEKSNGTLFLPFLDAFVNNAMKIEQVQAVIDSDLNYYRLLVKTQISYYERQTKLDTPLLFSALSDMLQRKATDVFVNVMNELHDASETVRFKIAEPLTSQEIYYLIVNTEEVIYTSTYTNLYKRMMERFPGRRSDSLLMSVHLDRFKKFIKMAANYNRLDDFLNAMPLARSNQLMYAFVNGLQRTASLEDAVDVADSYGSIQNAELKAFLKEQVNFNIENSRKQNDRRGEVIYQILSTLFRSAEDSTINLSEILGIPPVYRVDYNTLQNAGGEVVQHVFFYGDEDGVTSFRNFMGLFNGKPEWNVTTLKEWVVIKALKGTAYTIYANLPLDYKQDLDQQAQEHLIKYLSDNNIEPTVVVHRGHSYHLKYTLRQMLPSSRIVMLGSCGGYQNLAKILNINEDAHIISTKQVGSYSVNEPILRSLNEHIRNGKNIEWISFWNQVGQSVKSDARASELIKDYVPPHKNLGAIFIKAYRKATSSS